MTHCPRCGKTGLQPDSIHTCTPKALVLADELLDGMNDEHWSQLNADAADELRRLHAENDALRKERDKAASEIQRWIDLAHTWVQEVKTEQRLSFRAQMQQYAAQVEADQALLRQALEALEYASDCLPPSLSKQIAETIAALRERLGTKT